MKAKHCLISFSEAARLLPRPVHPSTLHRWADFGLGGVTLQSQRQGGRRYTTAEWLAQFIADIDSHKYLQDQVIREKFERALAEKLGLMEESQGQADRSES
jgi:hypothetical protein